MCVYKIQNTINDKCYIGISKLRFTLRYGGKWWKNTHNSHLKNSVAKYGIVLGSKNPNAKKVLNTETGVIYATIAEAALVFGVHREIVSAVCHNKDSKLPLQFLRDI